MTDIMNFGLNLEKLDRLYKELLKLNGRAYSSLSLNEKRLVELFCARKFVSSNNRSTSDPTSSHSALVISWYMNIIIVHLLNQKSYADYPDSFCIVEDVELDIDELYGESSSGKRYDTEYFVIRDSLNSYPDKYIPVRKFKGMTNIKYVFKPSGNARDKSLRLNATKSDSSWYNSKQDVPYGKPPFIPTISKILNMDSTLKDNLRNKFARIVEVCNTLPNHLDMMNEEQLKVVMFAYKPYKAKYDETGEIVKSNTSPYSALFINLPAMRIINKQLQLDFKFSDKEAILFKSLPNIEQAYWEDALEKDLALEYDTNVVPLAAENLDKVLVQNIVKDFLLELNDTLIKGTGTSAAQDMVRRMIFKHPEEYAKIKHGLNLKIMIEQFKKPESPEIRGTRSFKGKVARLFLTEYIYFAAHGIFLFQDKPVEEL